MSRTSRTPALAVAVGVLLLMASCGGSDSTSQPDGQPAPSGGQTTEPAGQGAGDTAVAGAPCTKPDMVVHVEATNSDLVCRAGAGGALVWEAAPSSGGGGGDGGGSQGASFGLASSSEIPAVMETFGFDLAPFDAASGAAGAMTITGVVPPKLPASDPNAVALDARNRYLFLPFGYAEADQTDPQWSFFLPLGTPVVSLVTGTVCDVPQLYSNDYSIRVVPDGIACDGPGRAPVMFETEHVIDPQVAVGDKVTAGQRIATVSDYQRIWKPVGFGIVEIGVAYSLANDNTPWHACPSRFFAPATRDAMRATLESLMTAWSTEVGDAELYAAARVPEPGCFSADVNA